MKNLNIREMRQELTHLDELLAKEGELLITRRGKPFARILPLEPASPPRRMESLRWLRDQMPLQDTPSEILVREDRDARD